MALHSGVISDRASSKKLNFSAAGKGGWKGGGVRGSTLVYHTILLHVYHLSLLIGSYNQYGGFH